MELDNFLALIFRLGILVIIYYLLYQKFHREYKNSKDSGFKNTYFLGFTLLFLILFVFHIFYGTYELYVRSVVNNIDIKSQFQWYIQTDDIIGDIVNNQMRPAFLFFYFLINIVLAAQIYPLEKANNWDKNPIMKFILICGFSVWLLFIPAFGNSPFVIIPVLLAFFGIAVGFLLNILIFTKLYVKSTGDVKKRSLYGIFAFLFLAIGLLLAMEVGLLTGISDKITYRWEVVIGSVLQIIGAIFYYEGFTQFHSTNIAGEQNKPKKLGLLENIKGKFSKNDLLDYVVIFSVIVFLLLGIAWLFYPLENGFSILKDTISFLGSSDANNNPEGWWFFSISLIIFGLMLLPLALYRFRRLKEINKPLSKLSFLFYILASIGIILIALIPDNGGQSYFADLSNGRLHNIVAVVAFAGFGLAFLTDLFVYIYDRFSKKLLKKTAWILVYITLFIVVSIAVFTQIAWGIMCKSNCWPGDGIYSFPLWEWVLFFMIFFILYTLILTLPNDLKDLKNMIER